ncbi:MAG TPA: hypothetical protein VI603_10825 [Saprospiraceae bacterium]|nr:hypothetical protein [Saprospiraceae bacterium]
MLRYLLILPIVAFHAALFQAQQQPILIAENTFKVNGVQEETFYYGFAAGDQIVFDFEEMKGKGIKELEIVEFPGSSKFLDYKTTRHSMISYTRGAGTCIAFASLYPVICKGSRKSWLRIFPGCTRNFVSISV